MAMSVINPATAAELLDIGIADLDALEPEPCDPEPAI